MEEATIPADDARPSSPRPPQQRWRLVFARPGPSQLTPREAASAWKEAVLASGLPVAVTAGDSPRPRLVFAATLPAGATAEAELADLFLHERRPAWDVRARLTGRLPEAAQLVELYDVWLGEPALPGLVVAADWRITLDAGVPALDLSQATESLVSAASLPRERVRGGSASRYDLRPLVGDVTVERQAPPILRVRTLFHAELGVGRPQEVVAALGELMGQALSIESLVREGLVLGDARGEGPARRTR